MELPFILALIIICFIRPSIHNLVSKCVWHVGNWTLYAFVCSCLQENLINLQRRELINLGLIQMKGK